DAIAAQGTLYTHAFSSCFWTLPAHASLFTGLHPLQAGATSETLHLPEENTTIAEALSAVGYRTSAYVCNSWVSKERGFAQGFGEFTEMWRRENQVTEDSTASSMEVLAVDKMEQYIENAAKDGKPFFLFANLNGVHLPYRPAPAYVEKFVANRGHDMARVVALSQITSGWSHLVGETPLSDEDYKIMNDLYDGEVAWADELVGRVAAAIDQAGITKNTVFIIMADHGEHLGEHGKIDHMSTMYDPALHIPLVIRYGSMFKAGERNDKLVSIVDIAPTLLHLCNAADRIPGLHAGITSLANPARVPETFVLAGNERPLTGIKLLQARYPGYDYNAIDYRLRCLRSTESKLIYNENHGAELYNLVRDPAESNNLAESQAATQRDMMGLLTKSFDAMGKSKQYFMFESTDREALERLRSLGYIN
ncbi:MAG TPA: sulfatase, partial [Candidatus Krumholzibacteria bacterium]|nr:sulfatase [Candidatus Krumholzibacteria bacterium]